jgi:hypothetical protein
MASEHEKLVEEVAKTIADWPINYQEYLPRAERVIAIIDERTKEATLEMIAAWRKRSCQPLEPELDLTAMHAASALWPSHGTDGKEEKAK